MPPLAQDRDQYCAPVYEGMRVLASARTAPEVVAAHSISCARRANR